MEKQGILVYGATGTTGTLIAQKIKEVGLPATLAGRNLQKLQSIGKAVDLPVAAVDLNDTQGLVELVGKHKVVLHVAGPFTITSKPMIEACISTGTHYLDVTGEFKVMEHARTYDATAKEKGIMILPAVGFDVIPGGRGPSVHPTQRSAVQRHADIGRQAHSDAGRAGLIAAVFLSPLPFRHLCQGEDPLSKPPNALPSHGMLISGAKHILTLSILTPILESQQPPNQQGEDPLSKPPNALPSHGTLISGAKHILTLSFLTPILESQQPPNQQGEDPLSKPPNALPSHGTLISGAKHILTLGRSFLIRKELPPRSTMSFPAARLCTTSLSTPPFQSSSLASVPLFPVTPLPVVAPYSFARSFRLSPPCPSQQLSSSAPPSPQPFSSIHTYPPLPPCSGRSFLIRKELPPLSTMSFPAAELFSTSLSTSIPNITVYVPGKSSWVTSLFIRIIQFAARVWPFTVLLEKAIRMLPTPDTTPVSI
ncbi:unnamed protein product [Closterium sp. NIES-65]|nr:unnamed protein product [Closterium sp. NIES-65]